MRPWYSLGFWTASWVYAKLNSMKMMPIKATYELRIPDTQDKSGRVKHALSQTQKHAFEQLEWLVCHIDQEWETVKQQSSADKRLTQVEKLIHATKKNPNPKYPEYDQLYGYTPSYIRRALIRRAIGHVKSYRANHDNWVQNGKHGNEPTLGTCHAALTFFRGNGSKWDTELEKCEQEIRKQIKEKRKQVKAAAIAAGNKDFKHPKSEDEEVHEALETQRSKYDHNHGNAIQLNLYNGKTWEWYEVRLRKSDVDYINRYCAFALRDCPSLKKRGKNQWSLSMSFTFYQALDDTPLFERRILAVDLGINNSACMVVLDWKGTVLARKFLRLASEEDHLYRMLQLIREKQSEKGSRENKRLWSTVNGVNADIADKTVKSIIEMADLYAVHTIVLEHLDISGKKRGSKTSRQRLHLWCVKRIQKMVFDRAHRSGHHVSRVNAWGTSRLAYDGSGVVKRGCHIEPRVDGNGVVHEFGYGTVEFSSGKLYAADLNAAYNIGARYFVREISQVVPDEIMVPIKAEVPGVAHRSQCILSSLWMLYKALLSWSEQTVA